jgi:hypothetical protein
MAGQPFEIAQDLETGHAQAALAHRRDRGRFTSGMPDEVLRRQHDLCESAFAHRAQLGLERPGERDGIHAEVVLVHADPPGRKWLTTSSKVIPPR